MSRKIKLALLTIYALLMLWLLFGQRLGQEGDTVMQLQPLSTIRRFLWVLLNSNQPGLRTHAWINLAGNVVMFVPLGFLLPWIWPFWHKFWRHFLLMAAIIVGVELCQHFLRLGTCDVDDLLLNLVGTSIGFLLSSVMSTTSAAIKKRYNKE